MSRMELEAEKYKLLHTKYMKSQAMEKPLSTWYPILLIIIPLLLILINLAYSLFSDISSIGTIGINIALWASYITVPARFRSYFRLRAEVLRIYVEKSPLRALPGVSDMEAIFTRRTRQATYGILIILVTAVTCLALLVGHDLVASTLRFTNVFVILIPIGFLWLQMPLYSSSIIGGVGKVYTPTSISGSAFGNLSEIINDYAPPFFKYKLKVMTTALKLMLKESSSLEQVLNKLILLQYYKYSKLGLTTFSQGTVLISDEEIVSQLMQEVEGAKIKENADVLIHLAEVAGIPTLITRFKSVTQFPTVSEEIIREILTDFVNVSDVEGGSFDFIENAIREIPDFFVLLDRFLNSIESGLIELGDDVTPYVDFEVPHEMTFGHSVDVYALFFNGAPNVISGTLSIQPAGMQPEEYHTSVILPPAPKEFLPEWFGNPAYFRKLYFKAKGPNDVLYIISTLLSTVRIIRQRFLPTELGSRAITISVSDNVIYSIVKTFKVNVLQDLSSKIKTVGGIASFIGGLILSILELGLSILS